MNPNRPSVSLRTDALYASGRSGQRAKTSAQVPPVWSTDAPKIDDSGKIKGCRRAVGLTTVVPRLDPRALTVLATFN